MRADCKTGLPALFAAGYVFPRSATLFLSLCFRPPVKNFMISINCKERSRFSGLVSSASPQPAHPTAHPGGVQLLPHLKNQGFGTAVAHGSTAQESEKSIPVKIAPRSMIHGSRKKYNCRTIRNYFKNWEA